MENFHHQDFCTESVTGAAGPRDPSPDEACPVHPAPFIRQFFLQSSGTMAGAGFERSPATDVEVWDVDLKPGVTVAGRSPESVEEFFALVRLAVRRRKIHIAVIDGYRALRLDA